MILLIVVKVEEEERHCFKPSWGGVETVTGFIFLGSKSLQMVPAAMKLKNVCLLEEKL